MQRSTGRPLIRELAVRYVIALVIVAVLACAGRAVIQVTLTRQSDDNRKIRLTEEQLFLSRDFIKSIVAGQLMADRSAQSKELEAIRSTLPQLQKAHYGLRYGDSALQLAEATDRKEIRLFLEADKDFRPLLSASNALLCALTDGRARRSKMRYEIAAQTHQILTQERLYRKSMTSLLSYYQMEAAARIHSLKTTETILLCFLLLVLFLEGTLVLRPALKRLQEAMQSLEASEARNRAIAQKLARTNAELERFSYVVSHDLQEPLRMVSMYVGLIQKRYGDRLDAEGHEFVEFAVDGVKRMRQMILDLLSYARLGDQNQAAFREVDCGTVLDGVRKDLRLALEEAGATLEVGRLPKVHAHPLQLAQVFQNLLSNALKFRSDRVPVLRIEGVRQQDEWLFSVQDNGIGFGQEEASQIFVLFRRLNDQGKYPGTGIGLAICKRIVESHRGRIWAESTPGQGTTFYFTLPATIEASALSPIPLPSAPAPAPELPV